MKIGVNQIEYIIQDNVPIIKIFGRDTTGTQHTIDVFGFEPYFYVNDTTDNRLIRNTSILMVDPGYINIKGGPLLKITTKTPRDVSSVRSLYPQHYEADILFPNRFMIDLDIKGGIEVPGPTTHYKDIKPCDVTTPVRTCIIDIECDDHLGFPSPEKSPIICITVWDSWTKDTFTFLWPKLGTYPNTIQYNTEEEMLNGFLDYITYMDPDVLTGWNFNFFDAPYIIGRMNTLGINTRRLSRIGIVIEPKYKGASPVIRGRIVFDLLAGYKKMSMSEKESYRLDAIGDIELGIGKIPHTQTVYSMWKHDTSKLIEYNQRDVEICYKLDEKLGIVDFFKEIANYVGCSMEDTIHSSKVVDMYILHTTHDKFVLPSKHKSEKTNFKGAAVLDPQTGVFDNVVVLDLKSLYPMCMITLNASPETKCENGKHIAPNGVRFNEEPDGITRSILMRLLDARTEKKRLRNECDYGSSEYKKYDLQQAAVKVIMNAYYGVSGYNQFRLYDSDVAGAVTSTGRKIIEFSRSYITEKGYKVVYGDTDSCMITLDKIPYEDVLRIGSELESELNTQYDEFAKSLHVEKHYFETKFEKLYRTFFQAGTKKRYVGNLVWKEGKECDKIDITGFEYKRSDFSKVTKETQMKILTMILGGATFEQVSDCIRKIKSEFEEYDIEYIGVPGGISKDLNKYDNKDAHIRGAEYANKFFGASFGGGSKPKHLYIKRVPGGYGSTDVICFEDKEQVPDGFVVDYEKMFEKTIRAPIETITNAMGWSWSEIIRKEKQCRLF